MAINQIIHPVRLIEQHGLAKGNSLTHGFDNTRKCKVYDVLKKALIAQYDSLVECCREQGLEYDLAYNLIRNKKKKRTYNAQGILITIR